MKYIVYRTTNTINGKIYIGVHKTENPDVFDGYLGCGVRTYDTHSYLKRDYAICLAIRKYGVENFKRETLFVYDTLEEALNKEAEIVDEDFVNDKSNYNTAPGGGIPPAPVKKIYQYSMSGDLICEYESITEASIKYNVSNCSIGRAVIDKTPSLGFLWSDTKYDKIDINDFKINENKKSVLVYDLDNNLISEFVSLNECARFVGCYVSTIRRHILSGKPYKNYYYKWNGEEEPTTYRINKARKVGQYDIDGHLICIHRSVREAKKISVGVPMALRGRQKMAGGFVWRYIDDLLKI